MYVEVETVSAEKLKRCKGVRYEAHGMVFPSEKNGFHSHSSSRSLSLTSGNESGRQVIAGSRPIPSDIVLSQQ